MISHQSMEWNHVNSNPAQHPKRLNRALRACCAVAVLAALAISSALAAVTPLAVVSTRASADDGNVPANTLDGSFSTRWSASGDAQWIEYDLGASRGIGSVAIAWYQGDQRSSRFEIRTSPDRSAWTQVFSGASSGATTSFETYDVVDSTARYVSIVCHGNSVNLWNSITEVDLFAPVDDTTIQWKPISGAMFAMQWNSEPGTTYQVQASSNFVRWVDVSSPITSTTATQTWAENVNTTPAARLPVRYYRVKKNNNLPRLTVAASAASAAEGGGNPGTFTVSRSGSTASNLTVRYSVGGTAVNGSDYATLSGSVTISAGGSTATVTVSPVDDTAVEGNETVVLNLSADAAYNVGSPSSATVTITDNDQGTTQPTVTIAASDSSASETAGNPATFTFTRTGSTVSILTVRYSIGGTAANGPDYASLSGSVSIPAGSSSASVTINPVNDTAVEVNETVVLTLSADAAYVVGSPSSATVTITDNDSSGGGGSLPSSILNLSNWKLTLPVETSHAGSPDEYKQPELAGFQDPNYFYVNSSRDGVVFTANCGGATTSGSGYPRSELREMTSGGSANASWSTTSGTHTMEIRQAVTHLPAVKPHVVVGQIHDAADDVIVFRLEGSTLFVDENGERGPVLTSNYQLGTVFTVKFVARNGGVEAYYNGQYVYAYPVSASGCYFKAGCYTQSNTDRGDSASAYGQVVIYNVTVTHQ